MRHTAAFRSVPAFGPCRNLCESASSLKMTASDRSCRTPAEIAGFLCPDRPARVKIPFISDPARFAGFLNRFGKLRIILNVLHPVYQWTRMSRYLIMRGESAVSRRSPPARTLPRLCCDLEIRPTHPCAIHCRRRPSRLPRPARKRRLATTTSNSANPMHRDSCAAHGNASGVRRDHAA